VGFHELGHDLVFAGELGFELLDFVLLSVVGWPALTAIGERQVAIFEELLEPVVELVGIKLIFITEIGDGDLVDQVPFEDGDLLMIGKVTALLVHGETSVQVMLTRTERFSSFD